MEERVGADERGKRSGASQVTREEILLQSLGAAHTHNELGLEGSGSALVVTQGRYEALRNAIKELAGDVLLRLRSPNAGG